MTTQATQTVEATKPQHISLDDIELVAQPLEATQTVKATKPQLISLATKSFLTTQVTQTVEATKPQLISLAIVLF